MGKQLGGGHKDGARADQAVRLGAELAAQILVLVLGRSQQAIGRGRGLAGELELAPDLGTIQAEPGKLRDAVAQLLINAIKFTPDGGTIRLLARRAPDGGVRIDVSDTGMGIEPANLARIFDPFFTRRDVSRHCSGTFEYDRRGLGLGLSVAKAFVEMHGGQISVSSQLERGTTFTIALPPALPAPLSPASN